MSNILKVKNKTILQLSPNHENGEIAYCEDEKQYMMYKETQWVPIEGKVESSGLKMNLYDINKSIISQLNPLNDRKLKGIIKSINDWNFSDLYLLYGKEVGYFTLLKEEKENSEFKNLGECLIALLKENTDKIYSIDIEKDFIEIWIQWEDEPTILRLMDWKEGIVFYG